MTSQRLRQGKCGQTGIGFDRNLWRLMSIKLLGIQINPDDLQRFIEPPVHLGILKPCSNGEDHVRFSPGTSRCWKYKGEWIAAVEHASARSKRPYRRPKQS